MKSLSNAGLIKELSTLRKHLEPVLNNRFLDVLRESEKRLAGEVGILKIKKPKQEKRLTKQDRMQKYL